MSPAPPPPAASGTDLAAWLALARAPDLGPVAVTDLLARRGEPRALLDNPRDPALGDLPQAARDWLAAPDWAVVERDLAWAAAPGRHILTLADAAYPALLREIADPPPVLFLCGDPAVLDAPQLAMVGARSPTAGGAETARAFAAHLAAAGLVITSGLARGIDAAAHRGALDAGGATVAVLGTGPDRVYPADHHRLAHEITDTGGALVSEFPPGTPPRPGHFPRRNRLISGLALGTLVVEAAVRSGSLITARHALEQGREVLAIPGSIHNPLARGCHRLLREGAKLVETAADVIEELRPLAALAAAPAAAQAGDDSTAPTLDAEYAALLNCVDHAPTAVDTVVNRSGLTPETVSSMLLILELRGYVRSGPGGMYSRVDEGTQSR